MVSLEFFFDNNPSGRPMVMGSTQPLIEISTSNIFWVDKGDRCVELTKLSPSCVDFYEIWVPQHPATLRACPDLYRDWFAHIFKQAKHCQFRFPFNRAQPAERALCLFEGCQASPACPSDRSIKKNTSAEYWRNDINRGNRNSRRKTCLRADLSTMNRTRSGLDT